jgi:hypothetical protein
MEQPPKPKTPLGLIPLEQNTFEHDLAVSERYQNFSTELLRLSLLAMAALGFLLKEILLTNRPGNINVLHNPVFRTGFIICLVFLSLSAFSAMLHRYYGPDSKACHLKSLRLYNRNAEGDKKEYEKEIAERNKKLRISKYLLLVSGLSLLAGAISVIALFIKAV